MGPLTQEPDSTSASLLDRARTLESAAWNRLSAIYGPLVYRWCRRANLQEADAADVLQEVFRALMTDIRKFRAGDAPGGFRGWLFGITRHKIADHFRNQAKQPAADGQAAAQQQEISLPERRESEAAEERDIILHAAMEQISQDFDEHNWQAFHRTVIGQEKAADVANELGLTPGAVRQAKFRILQRLRRELDGL